MFSIYFEYAEYEYNISFLKFESRFAIDIGAPYMYPLNFEYTNILKDELITKNCNSEFIEKYRF